MGVYNRTNTLPGEVCELKKNLDDIKQAQIIGNDNLKIYRYNATIDGQTLTANITAIFKFTFTFTSPSNSYVMPRYNIINLTVSYNSVFYSDPDTVNDNTKKSWFYSVTTIDDISNVGLWFMPLCSDLGVASIERIS